MLYLLFLIWADEPVVQLLDERLNAAQRNDACYALRDDRTAEVNTAMRRAMMSDTVRACAARHLREAGAVDELQDALAQPDADLKIAALRELGQMRRVGLLPDLAAAANDENALVATNAVDAIAQLRDPRALPYLIAIAQRGQLAGATALARAAAYADPSVLEVARKYLAGDDVAAQVIAIGVLGDLGEASDLALLNPVAARGEALPPQGRGFGMMPAIDLSKVARNAMRQIEQRLNQVRTRQ